MRVARNKPATVRKITIEALRPFLDEYQWAMATNREPDLHELLTWAFRRIRKTDGPKKPGCPPKEDRDADIFTDEETLVTIHVDRYKREHNLKFLTIREMLDVFKRLGYRREGSVT